MNRLLGVAGCQMDIRPKAVDRNLESLRQHIELIKFYSPWVNLVVAPELCFQDAAGFEEQALPIPNTMTAYCADLAREFSVFLVAGSMYERAGDKIFNTTPVFDPAGTIIAKYRKLYPWRPHEKTAAGGETLVFDIPGKDGDGTRVGVCNCFDIWFPELLRDLVFKGAELIVAPTASGTADRQQELILARAAAIQHQCFVLSVNGAGCRGIGQSLLADPEGNVVQQAGSVKENLIAMLDMGAVDRSRQYGVAGVSRPLTSFFHEKHRFDYQDQAYEKSPIAGRYCYNDPED